MIRILFVTSEVYPLIKTGGLADVSASLPEALCQLGYDCQILLPGYPRALQAARKSGSRRKARFRLGQYDVALWQTRLPTTPVALWLVDCPALFDRDGDSPYGNEQGEDWWDNAHRFHLFCRVAARMAQGQLGLSWAPDVVHCNDWQTGLVPVFLQHCSSRPKTIFTIHNLAYQGLFSRETFRALGLPDDLWSLERLEFHGQLSFIKGGLVYSDALTTVSPTYAREIQSEHGGFGLDGLLRHRSTHLTGILNGIDTRVWDPETDPALPYHYGLGHLRNKSQCRAWLQQTLGLEVNGAPLLSFIGRLVDQKGLDCLLAAIPGLLARGCQLALLGAGENRYQEQCRQLSRNWPGQVSVTLGYNEALAHQITAGSDLLLMPSRYEPCGLNQLYSLRYGTVPVVHGVGGLNDTVIDPRQSVSHANGFVFREPDANALTDAVSLALQALADRRLWRRLQSNGMAGDYSWKARASQYGALYQALMTDKEPTGAD